MNVWLIKFVFDSIWIEKFIIYCYYVFVKLWNKNCCVDIKCIEVVLIGLMEMVVIIFNSEYIKLKVIIVILNVNSYFWIFEVNIKIK